MRGRSCRSLPASCRRHGAGSITSHILKEHRSRERPKLFTSGLKTKVRSSRARLTLVIGSRGAARPSAGAACPSRKTGPVHRKPYWRAALGGVKRFCAKERLLSWNPASPLNSDREVCPSPSASGPRRCPPMGLPKWWQCSPCRVNLAARVRDHRQLMHDG